MTKNLPYCVLILSAVILSPCFAATSENGSRIDLTEAMKDSLVYLDITIGGYEQSEPWKTANLSQDWACACAVSEYEVITTAESIANMTYMKALRNGQSNFVSAELKVVDYQANLCLIELDSNELNKPLVPLKFTEDFQKGEEVTCYWLSATSILYNARGYLDRVIVQQAGTSFEQNLQYVAANSSWDAKSGEVYCIGSTPVGIACWSNNDKEVGLVPAEIINSFLLAGQDENYQGLGNLGFAVSQLLDPAMRQFLKMPQSLENGVYISDVYNLGTGRKELKTGDVLLSIDGNQIDQYGRFKHEKYDYLPFDHLITGKRADETIQFELWREGGKIQIDANIESFDASEMLIPYNEYGRQPEYTIINGCIFQKLTREYLSIFGSNIAGESPSNLYYYYREMAFKPTEQRKDIVVLSYVLPTQYNLGYTSLGQVVVKSYNGMEISSIDDIEKAQQLNPQSKFDVIDFELVAPTLVISRADIPKAAAFVNMNYGIAELSNINP